MLSPAAKPVKNQDFLRNIALPGARFYLCDLAVHSPASVDVRRSATSSDWGEESWKRIESVNQSFLSKPVQYEREILERFRVEDFYAQLLRSRDAAAATSLASSDDWSFVAVTDRSVCKYSSDLSRLAWERRFEGRLVALPGILLELVQRVQTSGELLRMDVGCIFAPGTSEYDIKTAIGLAGRKDWRFGEALELGDAAEFFANLRSYQLHPSACVLSKAGISKGLRSEWREHSFAETEITIARLLAAKSDAQADELRHRSGSLLSRDCLMLIGRCGFDAVQVGAPSAYVVGGVPAPGSRAVPVRFSGALAPSAAFRYDGEISYVRLSSLSPELPPKSVFSLLRDRALRFGSTRFLTAPPGAGSSWIAGIEITPDSDRAARFWPFEVDDLTGSRSFYIPLSRHLNCLIGDRGSGKSAVIEALDFLLRPGQFDARHEPSVDSDWQKIAKAALQGCNIRVCWQGVEGLSASGSPLLVSRYFNGGGAHGPVRFSDERGFELPLSADPRPRIELLRTRELEKLSDPERLAKLLDGLGGAEVADLSRAVDHIRAELAEQRAVMLALAAEIVNLLDTSRPLREYINRRIEFDLSDKAPIREHLARFDGSVNACNSADSLLGRWRSLMDGFALEARRSELSSFLADLRARPGLVEKEPSATAGDSATLECPYRELDGDLQREVNGAFDDLELTMRRTEEALLNARALLRVNHLKLLTDLEREGLPQGAHDRLAKRLALDESERDLDRYRELVRRWDLQIQRRGFLVDQLSEACRRRSTLRRSCVDRLNTELCEQLDPMQLSIEVRLDRAADQSNFRSWLVRHAGSDAVFFSRETEALILAKLSPDLLAGWLAGRVDIEERLGGGCYALLKDSLVRLRGSLALGNSFAEQAEIAGPIPPEFRRGIWSAYLASPGRRKPNVEAMLELDEIIGNDVPCVFLNDRPEDRGSKPRPLSELSSGQRCSALLPLVLLGGTCPLVIDQPEDNLDNRIIKKVIVRTLSRIKLRRQIILATHNPNVPILGDVDKAFVFQAVGEKQCSLLSSGDLDSSDVINHISQIMEGGAEAFRFRQAVYEARADGKLLQPQTDRGNRAVEARGVEPL